MERAIESKIKHLEFIQMSIGRMATNSFLVKGWSITLISALAAVLAQKDTKANFWLIALFPALMFWGLDGYFLQQEKLFRRLYDLARLPDSTIGDFSMDTSAFRDEVGSWKKFMLSPTVVAFHLTVLVSVILIAVFVVGQPAVTPPTQTP
jgi:hypothetical protein